jgi:hypothetical protein
VVSLSVSALHCCVFTGDVDSVEQPTITRSKANVDSTASCYAKSQQHNHSSGERLDVNRAAG